MLIGSLIISTPIVTTRGDYCDPMVTTGLRTNAETVIDHELHFFLLPTHSMASADLIPVINVTPLFDGTLQTTTPSPAVLETVRAIHEACTSTGFFQVVGTNVSPLLTKSLQACLERFFGLPDEEKLALHVEKGGPAWRGYMPWGGEGTKGRPDMKEGLYAGAEHTEEHPLFGNPIYGRNQFPDDKIPELRAVVLNYIDEITKLGKVLCDAMSVGLGLEHDYMRKYILDCPEPVQLFRAFRYIKKESEDCGVYGIGEHSGMSVVPCSDTVVVLTARIDFGLLTILSQHGPGLQVRKFAKSRVVPTDPSSDANP